MKEIAMWGTRGNTLQEEEFTKYIVETSDIVSIIDLSLDYVFLFPDIEVTQEKISFIDNLLHEADGDVEDIEEILEKNDIKYEVADDVESPREIVAYSTLSGADNLSHFEVSRAIEFFNGSNWIRIWENHDTEIVILEIDDKRKESLDNWDGSNWSFRIKWNHGNLYPIIKLDGKDVTESLYLFEQYTQFQGDIPTGKIIDEEEVSQLRKEIGYY